MVWCRGTTFRLEGRGHTEFEDERAEGGTASLPERVVIEDTEDADERA